jgi:hypothetical protein
MKTLKPIVISLIVISVFSSCRDVPDKEFFLTEEQRSLLPYKGGETINFKPDVGEGVLSYTAEPPHIFYSKSSGGYNPYYVFERMHQNLICDNSEIRLRLYSDIGSKSINNYSPEATLYYSWKNDYEGFPGVFGFCWLPVEINEYDKNHIEVIGDIELGGKLYHDVFVAGLFFPDEYGDTIFDGIAYPLNYYFSPGYGVIRMDFSDSTKWLLEEVLGNH